MGDQMESLEWDGRPGVTKVMKASFCCFADVDYMVAVVGGEGEEGEPSPDISDSKTQHVTMCSPSDRLEPSRSKSLTGSERQAGQPGSQNSECVRNEHGSDR